MEDKRRFTRIIFSTPAQLTIGSNSYNTSLIDLSLKGALVKTDQDLTNYVGQDCSLSFTLPSSDVVINIKASIAHVEHNNLGMLCTKIDLDSISHLKRLISLNLGDEELLDRELSSLS
jgi:hypothetical protein